jgi:hypothetical protein
MSCSPGKTDSCNGIAELNNAKFGSLCEFVFENIFSNEKIERQHHDRVDFRWNDTLVDVKGHRNFKKKYTIPSKYHGTKLEEIRYILVEFFEDFVVISEEKSVLKIIKYTKINLLFSKWTNRRDGLITKTSKIPPDLSKLKIIKKEIATFFLTKNLNSKIIYRTCQQNFGNESPDNLMPKIFDKSNVIVFLNFNDHRIDYDNIKELIAYRNIDALNFVKLKKNRLHREKIDMSKIDQKFKFKSIEELKIKWN